MTIKPTASGMDVVPTCNVFSPSTTLGNTNPKPIPTAIARKIHSVKYRSRKDKRFILFPSPTNNKNFYLLR